MIWVILAAVGVPLWLIAIALITLLLRNRTLRHRPGNVPVRVRAPGKRWDRGHAGWVHDVFAFRGSPAAWAEVLEYVQAATARPATREEAHKLRGLDEPIIATLTTDDGRTIEIAASRRDRAKLLAPFDVDVDDDVGSDAAAG
jgi:hypothetical protein